MSRQGSEGMPQIFDLRREEMLPPDEVTAMLGLRGFGMGREADRGRVRLQSEHGQTLPRAGRLDSLPPAAAGEGAARAR